MTRLSSELVDRLKEAGFYPPNEYGIVPQVFYPSLSELIEACDEDFGTLSQHVERKLWEATSKIEKDKPAVRGLGVTPEDAVANMWLALFK